MKTYFYTYIIICSFYNFRIVRLHHRVELEEIQKLAMLPPNEVKSLTFTLLGEDYIQIEEINKSKVATGPMRTFYLFHIDLYQVVQMQIGHCYHALYNMMQVSNYKSTSNKRLIDKCSKVQISANMKEHGTTEQQLAGVS